MMADQEVKNQILFQPKPFPVSIIPEGSLIRDYIEMGSPTTEAPPQYHFSTILAAIATVCKRNISFSLGKRSFCLATRQKNPDC